MGRARRTLDRRTLREQGEAAERAKDEVVKDEGEEEEDEDEDEDAEEGDEAAAEEGGEEAEADPDADEDEEKPKKKKAKKVVVKKKAPTKPRTRAAKIVRMKVVWAVYSNSHQLLQEFGYAAKADAEAYLEKVTTDKKSGGPFFMQLLKKPMEKE